MSNHKDLIKEMIVSIMKDETKEAVKSLSTYLDKSVHQEIHEVYSSEDGPHNNWGEDDFDDEDEQNLDYVSAQHGPRTDEDEPEEGEPDFFDQDGEGAGLDDPADRDQPEKQPDLFARDEDEYDRQMDDIGVFDEIEDTPHDADPDEVGTDFDAEYEKYFGQKEEEDNLNLSYGYDPDTGEPLDKNR